MNDSQSELQLEEEQQELIFSEQIKSPSFLCLSNYNIVSICTNKQCKADSALMCNEQSCLFCSSNHSLCEQIKLTILTKLLRYRFNVNKNFARAMSEIQNQMMQKLKEVRQKLFRTLIWGNMKVEHKELIHNVFVNQRMVKVSGRTVRELLESLREKQTVNDNQTLSLLADFKKQCSHISYSLNKLREDITNKFYQQNTKIPQLPQAPERPQVHQLSSNSEQSTPRSKEQGKKYVAKIPQNSGQSTPKQKIQGKKYVPKMQSFPKYESLTIDSHIIKQGDKNALNYLDEILQKPREMILIFRGSQNNFSALKFHEACDNISHTATLILTEYHKIIGGYTPLSWKSLGGSQMPDHSKESFIFSLTLKQKMGLVQSQNAILNDKHAGPCFGKKDIYIANKCNQNSNSHSSFPKAYNSIAKPLERNSEITKSFCGAVGNTSFKVKEYQVYKLVW